MYMDGSHWGVLCIRMVTLHYIWVIALCCFSWLSFVWSMLQISCLNFIHWQISLRRSVVHKNDNFAHHKFLFIVLTFLSCSFLFGEIFDTLYYFLLLWNKSESKINWGNSKFDFHTFNKIYLIIICINE